MIAEHEQFARLAVVQSALASQRMEGLEPEQQVLEDAQKWARGEKTITQAIADFKAQLYSHTRPYFFEPDLTGRP